MYLIKGHIISLLYFALSTSSFTVLILFNILYSCTLSGSGNKIKSKKNSKIVKDNYYYDHNYNNYSKEMLL